MTNAVGEKGLSHYSIAEKYAHDNFQREVIGLDQGKHLVLAPPGCGKTDILAERVVRALSMGVPASQMACLTFTNRAARGMRERIAERLGLDVNSENIQVFVGNVHRFCAHFLFSHGLLRANTMIIDEKDTVSILKTIVSGKYSAADVFSDEFEWDDDDEDLPHQGGANYNYRQQQYLLPYDKQKFVLDLQHVCYQIATGVDMHSNLILNADCVKEFANYFANHSQCFTPQDFILAYQGDNPNFRYDDISNGRFNPNNLMHLLQLSRLYEEYKQELNFVDFNDLLIMTYNFAKLNYEQIDHYSWIQVDEMQDLSPLQFALIELFSSPSPQQVTLFLGDEQQAIYSFIGARRELLEDLKASCGEDNIHRLYNNYRSPRYLLDIFNDYAKLVLQADPQLLPRTQNTTPQPENGLALLESELSTDETNKIISLINDLKAEAPNERIAILVRTNKDADTMSEALYQTGIEHFKVSGIDLFTRKTTKTLLAHLTVLYSEFNLMAWARLLSGLKVFRATSQAIRLVTTLKGAGMLPNDLLMYENSSYLKSLSECYADKTYVIFDTETTGLDIFADDIVQIAALKCRGSEIVEEFNIILQTQRSIPEYLGDLVNPLVEVYADKSIKHYDRAEGLQLFLAFVGDCPLIGHNVRYDYHILDENLKRVKVCDNLAQRNPVAFDTLKAIKLIEPNLESYRLQALIERFNLEGENSHLADADIVATKSLLDLIVRLSQNKIAYQEQLWAEFAETAQLFRERYGEMYQQGLARLYERPALQGQDQVQQIPVLVTELASFYDTCCHRKLLTPKADYQKKLQYILDFLTNDVIDARYTPSLYEQLNTYIFDINTFKEVDLCDSSSIKENIFVSTVHKAKGLEFESVIIFNASNKQYPHFYEKKAEEIEESKRLFYVGMTRAKKRLIISYAQTNVKHPYWPQFLSPFIGGLRNHFSWL